jgi:hypothetical protein
MTITSTIYLSTDTSVNNPPINKSNLANVSWIIDWDTIFHGKTGKCKITTTMTSKKGSVPDIWNNTLGIMTATLSSNYTLNNNGFPLAPLNRNQYIEITTDSSANYITASVYYYCANSLQNTSPSVINIPQGKSVFTIMMLDTQGNYITSFPEYNIFLYFEWEE